MSSVKILDPAKFSINNGAYRNMERAIDKAGETKDFASIMRIKGRMLAEGLLSGGCPNPETVDTSKLPKLYLDYIEIEGPLYEQWPPKSHQALFFKGKSQVQDLAYAREMFARFMPKAFRRPVSAGEVEAIVGLVKQELDAGTNYEEAIRVGLTGVLTSPSFIYLFEPGAEKRDRLTIGNSQIGCPTFFGRACRTRRHFEPRSRGDFTIQLSCLTKSIACWPIQRATRWSADLAEWLKTDEFLTTKPDEKLYRDYNDKLGQDMVGQSLAFFEYVLTKNLPVTNFLDSDFTLVNERLAKFYGIDGVKGDAFRVVQLPAGSPRGGLLGQAGIIVRGSDGSRTKPVQRGVYVRDVLFNDPPDPPPPNVGEIEPNIEGKNLTVRDRLKQHQKIETCAACHRGIDPYGLALENFNAIGAWRTQQDGENFRGGKRPAIDASGKMPNGKTYAGFAEFKRLLLDQKDRFRRALAEKMFLYASLGPPAEPADRSTVMQFADAMAADKDTFHGLIEAIVASEAFEQEVRM